MSDCQCMALFNGTATTLLSKMFEKQSSIGLKWLFEVWKYSVLAYPTYSNPERKITKPYFGVNVWKDDTITIIMNENDKLLW